LRALLELKDYTVERLVDKTKNMLKRICCANVFFSFNLNTGMPDVKKKTLNAFAT
jgi:hypothetical protein